MRTEEEKNEIYFLAMSKWGIHSQVLMLVEEVGELLQALSKIDRKRNDTTVKNLTEEIADVELMLEQICRIYVDRDDVEVLKEKKLERLVKILEDE